jgi:hypothetical protein
MVEPAVAGGRGGEANQRCAERRGRWSGHVESDGRGSRRSICSAALYVIHGIPASRSKPLATDKTQPTSPGSHRLQRYRTQPSTRSSLTEPQKKFTELDPNLVQCLPRKRIRTSRNQCRSTCENLPHPSSTTSECLPLKCNLRHHRRFHGFSREWHVKQSKLTVPTLSRRRQGPDYGSRNTSHSGIPIFIFVAEVRGRPCTWYIVRIGPNLGGQSGQVYIPLPRRGSSLALQYLRRQRQRRLALLRGKALLRCDWFGGNALPTRTFESFLGRSAATPLQTILT